MRNRYQVWLPILLVCLATAAASAQSFRVQCPTSTITHPDPNNTGVNNAEPAYTGPTQYKCSVTNGCGGSAGNVGYLVPNGPASGAIKCQQISGGDGYATMGDGTQTYMFSFGPLSGLADMASGLAGTEFPNVFNDVYTGPRLQPGDPATSDAVALGCGSGSPCPTAPFSYNGAVGLTSRVVDLVNIYDASEGTGPTGPPGTTVTIVANAPLVVNVGDPVQITNLPGYNGTWIVSAINIANPFLPSNYAFQYVECQNLTPSPSGCTTGLAEATAPFTGPAPTASTLPVVDGHVDPRPIMDVAVMNGNIPAPLMAFDEDDEFFLTLTNVGMIMRPDLFEQHTVHFHGYPNASSFFDGVPDASVAINIGASFTYYYLAPEAGTYFWHCHITPPEHLQMGMVGQLYVRPRQDRVPVNGSLHDALVAQQNDPRTACRRPSDGGTTSVATYTDILCSNPVPAVDTGVTQTAAVHDAAVSGTNGSRPGYAYNDGDGSTYYDVEYPIQIHGFDPTFHFVGMTFNPEGFVDMKDKYFLLNGRSYPDTVTPGPLYTMSTDGALHYSQPLPSIISMTQGQKALLRIADLDVTEYQTLASLGIPMKVIALNAKLLRDQEGNNLYYTTNSITLAGGESLDVILDSTGVPKGTYYLYTPNLDHLSNDAENFGGLMTEVRVN